MIVDSHVHIFRRLNGFTGAGRVKPLPYGMVRIGEGRPFRLMPPALERTNFPAEFCSNTWPRPASIEPS